MLAVTKRVSPQSTIRRDDCCISGGVGIFCLHFICIEAGIGRYEQCQKSVSDDGLEEAGIDRKRVSLVLTPCQLFFACCVTH